MKKEEHRVEPVQGPKPGDDIVRVKTRQKVSRLRRVLGTGGIYSMAYGDVGSSIYYALGITAFYALGATPIALGIAGIFFLFTAYTYAEGSTMLPESGGSCAYARRALNNFWGFVSGWGLMLVYVVTMSLSALSAAYYFSNFFPIIKANPFIAFSIASIIIVALGILNTVGAKESSNFNIILVAFDILLETSLVIVGFFFIFNARKLLSYIDWSGSATWPSLSQLPYAIAVGMVGYVGLEAAAQVVEETRYPERTLPKALFYTVWTVLFYFIALPVIALSAMTPQELKTKWLEDPIAGIAHHLPVWVLNREGIHIQLDLSQIFAPAVAILAGVILIVATNAALMAASRLSFSMSRMDLFPKWMNTLHKKFRTPFLSIILTVVSALLILVPAAFIKNFVLYLGDLYRFGAMMAFIMAHLSIIVLRYKMPNRNRPFKAPLNIRIGKGDISITAVLGFIATFFVWITVVWYRPWARWVGFGWIALGLALYLPYTYKTKKKKPV